MNTTPLQIGQIDLSFHKVTAAIILAYFDTIGQAYQLHTQPHEKLFEKYRKKEIDMILGAWLPSSHGKYIREVENETHEFSTLYTPFCIWGVPDYLPKEIEKISDITNPAIAKKFNKTIQGINEGAGISRFSRNIIKSYGLDSLGFKFKTGTISDCTNTFIDGYKKKEWLIIPLWKPQYLFHTYTIRPLKESKGLLGGKDKATILINKNAVNKLTPKALEYIKNVTFGNQLVTKLDYEYQVNGNTLQNIAKTFSENKFE
ncbi:glycine betaine ABC transporter substrate-binding protein [Tenacibaculum sp. FZY0031]|uniref:glycine betaine ABC transporter substrate-binding protein n=1 Tax=unclassified Tenacibaculum TaxID=2635139 RepID=UPI002EA07BB3|nr:glycine betaine ABC transporter substrate-binding protein [Tenacibaculum sp. FZY0031]